MSTELSLLIATINKKYKEKNGFNAQNHSAFKRDHGAITFFLGFVNVLGYFSIAAIIGLYVMLKITKKGHFFIWIMIISFIMSVLLFVVQAIYDYSYTSFIRNHPNIVDKFARFTEEILKKYSLQDDDIVDFLISQLNVQLKGGINNSGLVITALVSICTSLISKSVQVTPSFTTTTLIALLLLSIILVSSLTYRMYSKLSWLKRNHFSLALDALSTYKIYKINRKRNVERSQRL